MKKSTILTLLSAFTLSLSAASLSASWGWEPYHGLDQSAPVQSAGSDARSNHFQNVLLPKVNDYINDRIIYSTDPVSHDYFAPDAQDVIDANTIYSNGQSRIYFISEEQRFNNSLGFTTGEDYHLEKGDDVLLFAETLGSNTPDEGDFVDINANDGDKLNFFMARKAGGSFGYNPLSHAKLWWTNTDANDPDDQFDHVKAISIPHTSLVLLAWEEENPLLQMPGSGKHTIVDFDDVFAVVEGVVTPEPETYLIMAAFLGFVAMVRRKQDAKATA